MVGFILILLVSFVLGFWLIRRGARNTQAAGHDRDRIATPDTPDTRARIDRWAQAHGYQRVEEAGVLRYRKGNGLTSGQPAFLDVRVEGGTLSLESYVSAQTPLARKPAGEMALGAPGIILVMPRKSAKRDHNALRSDLGLPPIA